MRVVWRSREENFAKYPTPPELAKLAKLANLPARIRRKATPSQALWLPDWQLIAPAIALAVQEAA